MDRAQINERFDELSGILLDRMNPQGFWIGRLSSSALGVAVAVAALHFHDQNRHQFEIHKGLKWLQQNVNDDGSFGDTPTSPGNVSTSLLVYAACNLYTGTDSEVASLQQKIARYLAEKGIDVNSSQVSEIILEHYQNDYTFSVPILTMCGLCGVPANAAFDFIPQLPFSLSLIPRSFYRWLNLSVVSYAIPALIAVGIVLFKKKRGNFFSRMLQGWAVKPSLQLLNKLMPEGGGFLEAIPLTAFVSLSLIEAGCRDEKVVEKGIGFLLETQREDGSWPIDVDLSTWVTSLSVKALRSDLNTVLTAEQKMTTSAHLLKIQNKQVHPFSASSPGGWGWTNFPGSVPDGDDTPGVILALLALNDAHQVFDPVVAGCDWLLKLQNSDGGFPTFSKGWGKLPFDQSCADLTGHAMLAISSVIECYADKMGHTRLKRYHRSFKKGLDYLNKFQEEDGSWLPLWFGSQETPDHSNPVYGTARVLSYLNDTLVHQWIDARLRAEMNGLLKSARGFLLRAQNADGSWGAGKGVAGTMEETSLAISALIEEPADGCVEKGFDWLHRAYSNHGLKPAPIGLYFASLWYDEEMYPLTFYLEALSRLKEL